MASKLKQTLLLLVYFLIPVIISVIYLLEKQVNLVDRIDNVSGIFSFIWMCLNIIIVTKIKLIEKNFSIQGLMTFHTYMSTVALFLAFIHGGLFVLKIQSIRNNQLVSGIIGFVLFFVLMLLAIIFMSNRWLKFNQMQKLRLLAYKTKFRYNFNKILHNITILAVFVVYIHTLLSFTSMSSLLLRGMYFFSFNITFISWISHKTIRNLRKETDPYLYRKASWDDILSEISQRTDTSWTMELIEENPSLFTCFQCGSCTSICPVSDVTKGDYNPRKIMENVILGLKDNIFVDKIPDVWDCTYCNSCEEICPQHIKLTDVFASIKNSFAEQGDVPEAFIGEARMLYKFGVVIPQQDAITRRSEKLGIPKIPIYDLQEIQDLLEMAGFKKIIETPKVEKMKEERE
jgi:heterodisulfide reductase subunit C